MKIDELSECDISPYFGNTRIVSSFEYTDSILDVLDENIDTLESLIYFHSDKKLDFEIELLEEDEHEKFTEDEMKHLSNKLNDLINRLVDLRKRL